MITERDIAFKLGCGRLLFEHGAIYKLADEVKRFGNRAYIVIGKSAAQQSLEHIEAILNAADVPYYIDMYSGTCSEEKGIEIAERCNALSIDVIIGVGGGRIMDLAKIAANIGKCKLINVPTISATCAAYTPLSVVYTADGKCRGTWYFEEEVSCVLCELDYLCKQSRRYLAAGIADSIAKHIEIAHHVSAQVKQGEDVRIATFLAKIMYEELLAFSQDAFTALDCGSEMEALEKCIFHVIITTGLISGIARGRFQAALAHALYESIRTLYTKESRFYLHGEIVAVNLLVQEMYLKNEDGRLRLMNYLQMANMPKSLRELGVIVSDYDTMRIVMQKSVIDNLHSPNDTSMLAGLLKKIS